MKRVLVTGARGFIGRWIAQGLIERGYDVHAATSARAPEIETRTGITWHTADLMYPDAVAALVRSAAAEILVHAAWFTEHGAFWHSDRNYNWVAASLDLVMAFVTGGGRRVVSVGTCAEYDWRHGFCSESVTPLLPDHPYGVCKVALSNLVSRFAADHDVSCAWARVFYPYGPGEPPGRLVSSVVRALLEDRDAPCTQGTQVRDFMHVADCGDAIAALAASQVVGAVNIGSGAVTTIRDLVGEIGRRIGRENRLQIGALPMRPDDPPVLIPDIRRLRQEVAWTPRFTLDRALNDTIGWWAARRAV